MVGSKISAAVTGATGVIGSRIIRLLVSMGIPVSALSRQDLKSSPQIRYIRGGLEDKTVLKRTLKGAKYLFHCAGEKQNPALMYSVNVEGTKELAKAVQESEVRYFCLISSAGVIGSTRRKLVDESCRCRPQNLYETTKYQAERILLSGIKRCRIVILRPTNVVSADNLGVLEPVVNKSFKDRFKLFVTGGEYSNIIHADNVAAAALYLNDYPSEAPECFFVSSDNESAITFSEIDAFHQRILSQGGNSYIRKKLHLPILIPYLVRKLRRRQGNLGDVRYSSEKLLATGFKFPFDIRETLHQIFQNQMR